MSYSYATTSPFTGTRTRPQGGITAADFQGPVPARLAPEPQPVASRPSATPIPALDEDQRREKARRGAANRWKTKPAAELKPEPKPRPSLYPCPACDGRSKNQGHAYGRGAWRKCLSCGKRFRTHPPKPPRIYPPCQRCGGETSSNGQRPNGLRRLKCKACQRTHHVRAEPEPFAVIDLSRLPGTVRHLENHRAQEETAEHPECHFFIWLGETRLAKVKGDRTRNVPHREGED